MKYFILIISLCTIISGCASEKEERIFLFNGISFSLYESEELVPIDEMLKEKYESYFSEQSVQVPLFKCIKADNYLIFIGIPFDTSVEELSSSRMNKDLEQVLLDGDSNDYLYKRYRAKGEHLSVYAQDFDNNLVYVLSSSSSAGVVDSLLNKNNLANRFDQ